MTVMQLLVPLEDESVARNQRHHQGGNNVLTSSASSAASRHEEGEGEVAKDNANSGSSGSSVLSDELREQFEAMKAVWRQAKRASSVDDDQQDHLRHETDQHEQQPQDLLQQELKRKARETAVETAIAVDDEIARWQNGIADLEALLAAEEEDAAAGSDGENEAAVEALGVREIVVIQNHPRPGFRDLRFPHLPPVVPTDCDDDDDDDEEGGALSDGAPASASSSSTAGFR